MENDIRKTGIVNWRLVAEDGDGREQRERRLSFLGSGAAEEEDEVKL